MMFDFDLKAVQEKVFNESLKPGVEKEPIDEIIKFQLSLCRRLIEENNKLIWNELKTRGIVDWSSQPVRA